MSSQTNTHQHLAMKIIILATFIIFLQTLKISAQCPAPTINETSKTIASKTFEIKNNSPSNEMILTFKGSVENASWAIKDSEGATVTLFTDGVYNQDVILFGGSEKFLYRAMLGKFAVGKHIVTVVLNELQSAKNTRHAKMSDLNVSPIVVNTTEDKIAVTNAPILYLRPDTIDKFSDIPLITYYEIIRSNDNSFKIRYTTIFTNEDGGTQTTALMARWGRATDIEWVYELEITNGVPTSEIIQGVNHITKNFVGARMFGNHPVIFDAADNNNFADTGCSALRIALPPTRMDLSDKSRETVMDTNAWTYRIMAQEAFREGRVDPNNLGENTIDDLRNYLYVEIYSEPNSAAVAIESESINGKISRSDFNDAKLRITRGGYQRIAVRFPDAVSTLKSLKLVCEPVNGTQVTGICQSSRIIKFLKLDTAYKPLETVNPDIKSNYIKTGEKLIWFLKVR